MFGDQAARRVGMPIHTNPILSKKELIRMCRSKKKRIRKKWLKNPGNYREVPDDGIYVIDTNLLGLMGMGKVIVAHPITALRLKEILT
jgi:hypothetical protein